MQAVTQATAQEQMDTQAELLTQVSAQVSLLMEESSASAPSVSEDLITSAIAEMLTKRARGHRATLDSGMQTAGQPEIDAWTADSEYETPAELADQGSAMHAEDWQSTGAQAELLLIRQANAGAQVNLQAPGGTQVCYIRLVMRSELLL